MQVKFRTNSSLLKINNQTSLLLTDIHNERILKTSALSKTIDYLRRVYFFPSGEKSGRCLHVKTYVNILKNLPCFERNSETWARTIVSRREKKTPRLIWHYFFIKTLSSKTRRKKNKKTLSTFVVLENLECDVFYVNPSVIADSITLAKNG
jgi:hypothetical protein